MTEQQEKTRNPLVAGGRVYPIVARNDEDAARIAGQAAKAHILPKGMSVEQAYIAILAGAEMGLPPMSSLKNIAIINNRPCLWGDGLMALALASGSFGGMKKTVKGDGNDLEITVEIRRKGIDEPFTGNFSMAKASKANLLNKMGPWKEYPERMVEMRARAYALREAFADLLAGAMLAEEAIELPPERPKDADLSSLSESFESAPRKISDDAEDAEIVDAAPAEPEEDAGAPAPEDDYRPPMDDETVDLEVQWFCGEIGKLSNPKAINTFVASHHERLARLPEARQDEIREAADKAKAKAA